MSHSTNLFKKLADNRSQKGESSSSVMVSEPKKRGRPAGKRSNPDWIGRTYYVQRNTDLDVETELLKLKRQGVDLDKSELVDYLLSAWVKWHQGENLESQLTDISPRQKPV